MRLGVRVVAPTLDAVSAGGLRARGGDGLSAKRHKNQAQAGILSGGGVNLVGTGRARTLVRALTAVQPTLRFAGPPPQKADPALK